MSELKLPEINRLLLSGRLTRDPDKRYAGDGTAVTSFGLAFHRRYRGRDGSAQEQTGFVTVMTYQRLAEVCGQYLKKGNAVLVEGRLQMRDLEPERGGKETRLEVRAEMVHFLERRPEGAPAGEPAPPVRRSSARGPVTEADDRNEQELF
ncbi:MAG: single-stranded DNA-binding protein [Candidatus Eisenbacteria bacterium]|uniref:Single-stranded DNA-binding protein n=1 Tax=Eiseniibacteriota bacterium TaxID=2212470 RepID=A0A9D6L5C9_UNCEI|nr:single-stranded DNA-binding protein [Candidatus Eisenbacteria bacterium]